MTPPLVRLAVTRVPATQAQAEVALQALGSGPGAYFGVDAGVSGLHPLQATLLGEPALAFHLHWDGVEVEVLSSIGASLLRQPMLLAWHEGAERGASARPLDVLRGFLACFEASPDVLLLGALPFAAHRLAGGAPCADALGTLYFGNRLLRRDAAGAWTDVQLGLPGAADWQALRPATDPAPELAEPGDDHPPGGYAAMVTRALDWLRDKPLVSLTLSQSYRRKVEMSAALAFARLRQANPAPASFFFNDGRGQQLLGASPDLQLVIAAGTVQTLPVCGTVARRPGAVGEAQSLRELFNEEVDAASLAVCTDALRNDLAPLCEPASLQLLDRRRPMSLATVVHAVDRLAGTLRVGVDAWDAIAATAAPVMVTGTPRAQALAAIDALEASPRGWYGGLVVQVASNGDALAGTILRAAAVQGGVAQVRTGGDLMADSSPEREEQESRLKTLSVWRAFGLEPDAVQAAAVGAITLPATVAAVDAQDPFGQSMRDCLAGLGLRLDADARAAVVVGEAGDGPSSHAVFVGDAARRPLAGAGFALVRGSPQHGRSVVCTPSALAPWEGGPFTVARYASFQLRDVQPQQGWQVWACDLQGVPLALAHVASRRVCLLFRPDSLLSEPQAQHALRAAIAFAAVEKASL